MHWSRPWRKWFLNINQLSWTPPSLHDLFPWDSSKKNLKEAKVSSPQSSCSVTFNVLDISTASLRRDSFPNSCNSSILEIALVSKVVTKLEMHFIDTANVTLDMPYFSTLCKGKVKVDFSYLSVISVSNLSAGWCVKLSYCVILAASFTTTNDMGIALELGRGRGVCFIGFCGFWGIFWLLFLGFFCEW